MTAPQPRTGRPPTAKQLRYLRDLALKTGQSFAYPATAAEASREIDWLKNLRPVSTGDRLREQRALSRQMAERRGGGSAIDSGYELEGYGSNAGWSTHVEDEAEEEIKEREAIERAASWR